MSHKEAQRAQIGAPEFLRVLCFFVTSREFTIDLIAVRVQAPLGHRSFARIRVRISMDW
jgi:hypothetical protein